MSFTSGEENKSGFSIDRGGASGDIYSGSDFGTRDAMAVQNMSHTSVELSNEALMTAQNQIDQTAASIRNNMRGASEAEIQQAVQQAVGSLSLPPQLGQAQVAQMTQQALTRTDGNIFDNGAGGSTGQSQQQTQEQGMGGMFAGLFAMVAAAYAGAQERIGSMVERFSASDRQEVAVAGNTLANRVTGFEDLGLPGTTRGLDLALDRGPAQTPAVQVAAAQSRSGDEGWAISRT